jgi:hypothetical protein
MFIMLNIDSHAWPHAFPAGARRRESPAPFPPPGASTPRRKRRRSDQTERDQRARAEWILSPAVPADRRLPRGDSLARSLSPDAPSGAMQCESHGHPRRSARLRQARRRACRRLRCASGPAISVKIGSASLRRASKPRGPPGSGLCSLGCPMKHAAQEPSLPLAPAPPETVLARSHPSGTLRPRPVSSARPAAVQQLLAQYSARSDRALVLHAGVRSGWREPPRAARAREEARLVPRGVLPARKPGPPSTSSANRAER